MTEHVPAESCDDTNESETPTESTNHFTAWITEERQQSVLDAFIRCAPHERFTIDPKSNSDDFLRHHKLLDIIAECLGEKQKNNIVERLKSAADCRLSVFANPKGEVIVSLEIDQPSTDGVITVELLPSLGFLRQELEIQTDEASTQSNSGKHDPWSEEFFQRVRSELPSACLISLADPDLDDVRNQIEKRLRESSFPSNVGDFRFRMTQTVQAESLELLGDLIDHSSDIKFFLVEYELPPKPSRPFAKWREWVRANVVNAFETPLKAEIARPNVDVIPVSLNEALDTSQLVEIPWDTEGAKTRIASELSDYGTECLGWYQSYHVYDEDHAGIYLHLPRIMDLGYELHHHLMATGCTDLQAAFEIVIRLIIEHEFFHTQVEAFGLQQEMSNRSAMYRNYTNNVYVPLKNTSKHLEEALANYVARQKIKTLVNSNSWRQTSGWADSSVEAVIEFIDEFYATSPPGYRDWKLGDNESTWSNLANQVVAGQTQVLANAPPLEELLREIPDSMLRLSDVPIWMVTEPAITEHLFRTPAHREVERLLQKRGHSKNKKQGKGSHVKWTSPDGKVFIVPDCRELSPGVFSSLLKHLGCTKKEYLSMRSTL